MNPPANYRDMIKSAIENAKLRNRAYSLRSFAKDAGISPSYLSLVINDKRRLSADRAEKISRFQKWTKLEKEKFLKLVDLEHTVSQGTKDQLLSQLDKIQEKSQFKVIHHDIFASISRWHHGAIIELTKLVNFKHCSKWIGKQLGISSLEASLAVDRLLRLGLLKHRQNHLVPSHPFFTTKDIPSQSLRTLHQSMLEKAKRLYQVQPNHKRDFTGSTVAIKKSQIPEVKARIRQFRADLIEFLDTEEADAVYHLGIQFFQLNQDDDSTN